MVLLRLLVVLSHVLSAEVALKCIPENSYKRLQMAINSHKQLPVSLNLVYPRPESNVSLRQVARGMGNCWLELENAVERILRMSKFSFDESLFVIDMDDTSESFLTRGEVLADGIVIDEERDRGENFTFYVSEDGRYDVLAVAKGLAEHWLADSLLPQRALLPHYNQDQELDCYLLISPSALILSRLTDVRVYGSAYYAHLVASGIFYTRCNDPEINLRDGILCELYGVILPCYTLTPKLADISLLKNTLRGQYEAEDLRGPNDFAQGSGGLNRLSFNALLAEYGMATDKLEPCLDIGEEIDDMAILPPTYAHVSVTGPLELNEHYQIFSTDTDLVLLALSDEWGKQLFEREVILQMHFKPMLLGGQRFWLKLFSRRKAVENVDNRHFGINQADVFEFALALQRTRQALPEANLKQALYVQALGLLLPVNLTGGSKSEDERLLRDVVTVGPFAQGSFLENVLQGALALVRQ